MRRYLSEKYVVGQGVEIGALQNPLWTSERATVRYVDRLSVADLRVHYPELKDFNLVNVDIIDDGESLTSIGDGQLDFIIANHMLEHTENPLGTIRNHLRKIRPGGILYYAVPDKRFTFDIDRPITSFRHLVWDDRKGPHLSRLEHFYDWGRLVNKVTDPDELEAHVKWLMEINYSIHFHVWDFKTFSRFIKQAKNYLDYFFEIKHLEQYGSEVIVILEKRSKRQKVRLLSGFWVLASRISGTKQRLIPGGIDGRQPRADLGTVPARHRVKT